MSKTILIVGNVADGFRAIGPFEDIPQAVRFAGEFLIDADHWVSLELQHPSELSKDVD